MLDDPAFAHLIGVKFPRTNNPSNFTLSEWKILGGQLGIADNIRGKKFTKENWCTHVKDWKLAFEVNFVNVLEVADSTITLVCKLLLHTKHEFFLLIMSIAFIICCRISK